MKKALLIIIALFFIGQLSFAAIAIGAEIGDVFYTDIVTKINGVNINSFNINGSTAIYITELRKLGYDVNWDGEKRQVTVIENADKDIVTMDTEGVEGYVPENKDLSVGTQIGKVLYTDIKTTLGDTPVDSFNINGSTAIYVKSIDALGIDYQWDPELRQVIITKMPETNEYALEGYHQITFNRSDDEYILDMSTLPAKVKANYHKYYIEASNLFTEAFNDKELFEREYSPVSSRYYKVEDVIRIKPPYAYAYTIYALYDSQESLLGIIQFPKINTLESDVVQVNFYNPEDYDYEALIADKKDFIYSNLESSQELKDEWVDIIHNEESDGFNFYVNESYIPKEYQTDHYYVGGTNHTSGFYKESPVDDLIIKGLSRSYHETFDTSNWDYIHPVYGDGPVGIDEDSIVMITLYNHERELIGYRKTDYNEMQRDELQGDYKLIKIILPEGVDEENNSINLKYDGEYIDRIGDLTYGPFEESLDLNKIEIEGNYETFVVEDYQ